MKKRRKKIIKREFSNDKHVRFKQKQKNEKIHTCIFVEEILPRSCPAILTLPHAISVLAPATHTFHRNISGQ